MPIIELIYFYSIDTPYHFKGKKNIYQNRPKIRALHISEIGYGFHENY